MAKIPNVTTSLISKNNIATSMITIRECRNSLSNDSRMVQVNASKTIQIVNRVQIGLKVQIDAVQAPSEK